MNHPSDMQAAVGFAAGDIFHWLEQRNAPGDLNSLRSDLDHIDERVLHQGLGWLMREGKVEVHSATGSNYTLRLNPR